MSQGYEVLKYHKHDWLMILGLLITEAILLVWVPPFYRFVGKGMMTDLRYPFKGNTVPIWAVPMLALVVPALVFLFYYFRRRDPNDLHHAILGLLFSVLMTAVITDSIKDAVGRPRPDFFWRCFPDGNEKYDPFTQGVICSGNDADIKEGHKSFPSGHTSWCFAGLGYLSLYLAGKINLFDRRGHAAKLCVVFLPLLIAALVGVSRVDDYWHHWQDVFAGGLIGFTMATLCYRQFFPAPYHSEGSLPYPFFPLVTNEHAAEPGNPSEQLGNTHQYLITEHSQTRANKPMEAQQNDRSFDIESGRSG
eukprot:TRINITY_DN4900_c0_g1_i1.p1 TRINITY_DN4900_c0_g1~~TRINITY_DN4900_c0_g1_i1.p1  ORF type:complete len:306 (+),score=37.85 TRINITY_DN4900_c0_g1_i1:238-1155(+)